MGLYLSGHPLQEYTGLFNRFNFNTAKMPKTTTDEDLEPSEEADAAADDEVTDGTPVTMGAVVTGMKKVFTKAKHEEMAILTVEDLYGTCEIMLFPKTWAPVKHQIDQESVIKIVGKVSIRDGQNPIILAESVELLQRQNPGPVPEVTPGSTKKLYLRFNLQDEVTKRDCFNALMSYSGEIPVVVKDLATGNAFSLELKVRECKAIMYELEQILGVDNVRLQ